jgi:hypothetical protein
MGQLDGRDEPADAGAEDRDARSAHAGGLLKP